VTGSTCATLTRFLEFHVTRVAGAMNLHAASRVISLACRAGTPDSVDLHQSRQRAAPSNPFSAISADNNAGGNE
jgi:hypothetical protein